MKLFLACMLLQLFISHVAYAEVSRPAQTQLPGNIDIQLGQIQVPTADERTFLGGRDLQDLAMANRKDWLKLTSNINKKSALLIRNNQPSNTIIWR